MANIKIKTKVLYIFKIVPVLTFLKIVPLIVPINCEKFCQFGFYKMSIFSPIECTCFTRVIVIVTSLAPSDLIFFFHGLLNLLLQT